MEKIERFSGEYSFLSNFYFCDIKYKYCNEVFPTSEHLFQYFKTINPNERLKILHAKHPAEAKKIAKTVTLRDDWEYIKIKVMGYVLKLKFDQNRDLRVKLLQTSGLELVEGNNWHDNFWGVCNCTLCTNKNKRNMLGSLLMGLRESYINENTLNMFLR